MADAILAEPMTISLPIDAGASELPRRSPPALLIAMLPGQQVPLEKAFTSPRGLVRRPGHEPTAREPAGFGPEELAVIFSQKPALHRCPEAMAARVQQLCRLLEGRYGGGAARRRPGTAQSVDAVLAENVGHVPEVFVGRGGGLALAAGLA